MKLLILLLIGYLAYRAFKSWMMNSAQGHSVENETAGKAAGVIDDEMVKDPQCGVFVSKRDAVILRHQGMDLHFCSEACRDKFIAGQG